jgi:YggT family protein
VITGILRALIVLLNITIKVFYFLIIIRVILSWISTTSFEKLTDIIYQITEPFLRPLRIVLRFENTGWDLSPIIAIIILYLIERFIIDWLYSLTV